MVDREVLGIKVKGSTNDALEFKQFEYRINCCDWEQ